MKIKLTLSYDGTDFCGWQKQPKKRTVQQVLEESITALTGEKTVVVGSGRTDAGVHAAGQTASFETNATVPPEKFGKALNTFLPPDVRVLSSEQAQSGFNARKCAKVKTYVYSAYFSETEQPLKERYAYRLYGKLDVRQMQKAADILVGEHDFKAFSSTGGGAKTSVRTVYSIDINQEGDNLYFIIKGNGFLYNMVRIIVGTLLNVGRGKTELSTVKKMLETGERALGGETVPAKGLCLVKAEY